LPTDIEEAMSPSAVNGDDFNKVPYQTILDAELPNLSLQNVEPATLALHADDALNTIEDVSPPIHVSTTFRYPKDPDVLRPFHETHDDRKEQHIYSRHTTPSSTRLEEILASLLHAPCLTYSSGLSALHALLTFLNPKAIAIGDGYHGSHGVLGLHKRLTGCKILPLDCKPEELGEGDLICLETPVNPTGNAFNIQHYANVAHNRGAYLSVDSTFAPPPLQDPFRWGADVVMHSGTKYIGGHSDMLCGILAVKRREWLPQMLDDRLHLGNVMGGLEGWLGVRSVRTLELRVKRQSETALRIVDALDGALSGHTVGTGLSQGDVEAVKAVLAEVKHASLQASDMPWLRKQMPNGYGPVFSIVMKNSEFAKRLPSKLHLFHHATSVGGVESLIEWRTMTDPTVEKTLLRVSIGVEDSRDLLDDLLQALRALAEEVKE
jgi:cystathionine beta-lyase/cystathionine gamma-synthase